MELRAPADVLAALHDPALVPHHSADRSTGATMRLRGEMARFSPPVAHGPRRADVVAVIESIDVDAVRLRAADEAEARLVDDVDLVAGIARVVPTVTLWGALALPGPAALADVEAVVRVIGRGEPATATSDAAAERLLGVADVATVSLLYQDFDATSALIATTLAPGAAPAVPRTRRVAAADTSIGGVPVAAGVELVVEIGAAGFPFGAGPHECPGRTLAEAIVAGVIDAWTRSGLAIDPASIDLDPDGRPTRLVACRP